MKKSVILYSVIIFTIIFVTSASAYWIWTPQTKKFINPKYAVKDSPKEQFDWAMSFYDAKDYQRASFEFEKLTKQYEYSEYASKAQYYVGLCYENMGKLYIAFQNYQKAIDNFPHIENLDEILARQFNIGNLYASRDNPKILGTDIMTSLDRAIEIYKRVVDNAPYGKSADEAQFNMAEALKRTERYEEAIAAFQKLSDDYPNSKFSDRAQYEVAYCAYRASLKPVYDVGPTDKAIKAFEEFAQGPNRNKALAEEADKTIKRLKDRAAEKSLDTAKFYEGQKHYQSAIIYYQDILDRFPDSSFTNQARAKIEELTGRMKKLKGKVVLAAPRKDQAKAKEPRKAWAPFKFGKEAKPKKTLEDQPLEAKAEASAVPLALDIETKPAIPEAMPEVKAEIPERPSPAVPIPAPETIEAKVEKAEATREESARTQTPEELEEAAEEEIESSVEKLRY